MQNGSKLGRWKYQEYGPAKDHLKDGRQSWQFAKSHLKQYDLLQNS
jgi:hypothetical protein